MLPDKRTAHFLLVLLILAQGFAPLAAQDKAYARKVVDTLTSPVMHGRGYVFKGDKVAATYIANEFKKLGLLPLGKNFFQEFGFPINTLPKNNSCSLFYGQPQNAGHEVTANSVLTPGQDYLISSASPSVKGRFALEVLDARIVNNDTALSAFQKKDLRKSFLLVDTSGVREKQRLTLMQNYVRYPRNVKGILVAQDATVMTPEGITPTCTRLEPWDLAQLQSTVPVILIRHDDGQSRSRTGLPLSVDVNIDAKFIKNYKSQNVLGYVKGSQYPDSFIVFTAHYDHLGCMGKNVYFPGANDNASGVAMLLNLARYYAQPENKPKCSVLFIAFGAEEVGLIGSRFFSEHPLVPLKSIRFLVNMDILGTGDEGITVVNATLFDKTFKTMQKLNSEHNYLPQVKARGKASISDHYFFTEKGVPCFYIYTLGGIKSYHDVCDRGETLPLTKFDEIFRLLRDFTATVDQR